jgi:hypothetical protein
MSKPDYAVCRDQAKFTWSAGHTYSALLAVSGVPIRDYFLDPAAGIEVYRRGAPRLRALFGPEVAPSPLHTPPVSYGHVNGLGAGLLFPEGGEVSHTHVADTLAEAVRLVSRRVAFETAGMAPFYLEYRRRLAAAFPGEPCGLGYRWQGPLTTAYALRGDAVFYDPYDDPDQFRELLARAADSIVSFVHFSSACEGEAPVDPRSGGLCDDLAAMFGPDLWPEFVIPSWDRYYRGITTGTRSVHVEDLRPDHLPHLESAGIFRYDPGISPQLAPPIIRDRCRVPFAWRLGSFHYPTLTPTEIRDWVFQAVAHGAYRVFTTVEGVMCTPETARKVQAFVQAAQEVGQMLARGVSRESLGREVTPAGRRRFWDQWPDQKRNFANQGERS